MRPLAVVAVLALAMVPLPVAQAAEPLLKDNAADTVFVGAPGTPPSALGVAGQSESVDLVALAVEETDDELAFALTVAKLEGNPGGLYSVFFTWRDVEHRVFIVRSSGTFGNGAAAYLEILEADEWERVAPLSLTVDGPKATLTAVVPKVYILDAQKRPPNLGQTLTNVHARADGAIFRARFTDTDDYAASFRDTMPDDSVGVPLTLARGDEQFGHVSLRTDDRVRVSNGGSTTFVFQALLRSNATTEDEFTLALEDLPESWNGSVQSPIRVAANGEKLVTVLASVPFEHKHGGFDSFRVVALSKSDPSSRASLRLGVLHTPIPQPAGHHSELYLHAVPANGGIFGQVFGPVFPFNRGHMNTESTHEGEAEGVSMSGFRDGERTWMIPLNPSLRMGLDFDVDRIGELVGAISSRTSGEATLKATLVLVPTEDPFADGVVLAESPATKVVLDMQRPTAFLLPITPTLDADYIPYAPGQNLVLHIAFDNDGPSINGFGPMQPMLLAKDFKLSLPLTEYHDRLTGLGEVQEGLELVADGLVEKVGRPGTVMTYAFDLKNHGAPATIDLDVAGGHAELGLLVPAQAFELGRGETKRVTLAVGIPGDAATGAEYEVLVFAYAQEDPAKTAIVRTLTRVSTGANATDDEAHLLFAARDAEAKTPGFVAPFALMALAVLALSRRRRA